MRIHAHHIIAIAIAVVIVIAGLWLIWPKYNTGWPDPIPREIPLPIDETVVEFGGIFVCNAWIADNSSTRSEGLIGTERVETRGMLFVFDNTQYRAFHMNGMAYAIDIIFMDANREVVDIHADFAPGDETYRSEEPAMYALEIVSGRTTAFNIEVGSVLTWN